MGISGEWNEKWIPTDGRTMKNKRNKNRVDDELAPGGDGWPGKEWGSGGVNCPLLELVE